MAQLSIQTARFGEVNVDEDRVIQFVEPILGFPDSHRYVILDHAEDSPFKWLQSADEPELAFVVTNPKFFGIDYEFELSDTVVEQLGLTGAEDALVMTIVNIPQTEPAKMTANLMGPVVVSQSQRKAKQVVLGESGYSTKTRLIPDEVLQQTAGSSPEQGA
ncbi:MAG TPA: flagellar assembly protein FliW [Oculatellaceae cyanobacterium]|jgi:flagellar assembly factor FliW